METMLCAITINRECQTLRSWENAGAVLKVCCYWNCWKRIWNDMTAWKVVVNTQGVGRTKHGMLFRLADSEEQQTRQSLPADSRVWREVCSFEPAWDLGTESSQQQPLCLWWFRLPQTLARLSRYRWGDEAWKASTPYPSSHDYSVSEEGSQLMTQGFTCLPAELHVLPFFSNFLVHTSLSTVVVCLLNYAQFFQIPWIAARQASLSFTNSRSWLKLMSIESVMPSSHLILCHLLLLLPLVFPNVRVSFSESALPIRWLKDWGFSFSISPSSEYSRLISFRMDWLDLFAVQGALKNLLQHHSSKASIFQHSAFFIVQLSHP